MIQFVEHIFQRGWFNHQLEDGHGSNETEIYFKLCGNLCKCRIISPFLFAVLHVDLLRTQHLYTCEMMMQYLSRVFPPQSPATFSEPGTIFKLVYVNLTKM